LDERWAAWFEAASELVFVRASLMEEAQVTGYQSVSAWAMNLIWAEAMAGKFELGHV
jgi:hypothetical protein